MKSNFIHGQALTINLLGKFNDKEIYGRLVSISGFESISQLFKYKLTLITQNKSIINQTFCGSDISFELKTNFNSKDTTERYFNGIIEEVSFTKRYNPKDSVNPEFEYYLQVVPKLSNLSKIKHSRVFQKADQKLLNVIEQLLKEHDINYEIKVKNSESLIAETCIQYNETDYDFFYRLLDSAGIYYFFKHEKAQHVLVISNQSGSYFNLPCDSIKQINKKGKLFNLHNLFSQYSLHVKDFKLNAFSYSNRGKAVEETYSNTVHQMQVMQSLKDEESAYMCEIKDLKQATLLTEGFAKKKQALAEQITGESSYPSFAVGGKFKLEGTFFSNFKQDEQVIIEMTFTVYDYISTEQQYVNNFIAIATDEIFLPSKAVSKPIIQGLHFALIVNAEGESDSQEPYCDEKGKVYIKLLWGKNNIICKANVLSTSNGFTLPRVGSLAYIIFPHNNLYNDFPIVMGISNEDLLSFEDKEEWYKNIYMVSPGSSDKDIYNLICFNDKKDNQEIKVWARKDILYDIENDETINIKNNSTQSIKNIRTVTIEEGNDILNVNKGDILIDVKEGNYNIFCKGKTIIKSDGDITIDTKADLALKAGGKITIESKGDTCVNAENITLKSGNSFTSKAIAAATYEAGTSLDIKSNAQISIDSTITEIKGKANIKISSPLTKISM